MTRRETVLEQIRHQETERVPYTLPIETEVAERLDAHYGAADWRARIEPYLVCAAALPTMKKEPVDAIHERDLFGSLWRMDKRPFHLEEPALAEPSLDGYPFPAPEAFTCPGLQESAARVRSEQPDSFSLINIPWGLWESCWAIRGFENALMDCVAEPDFFAELFDRLTDLFLGHVAQCADADVDAILLGDDWGDQRGVLMGPDRWRKFIKPCYARIYDAIHAQGKLVISHCCGSVVDILDDIVEIGLDVLESVQPEARGMNPYALKERWGGQIAFWGCLGSQSTIPFGTPESIHAEVARLRAEMARGGGFILAPAKALQPGTPTANAVAALEAFTA